MNDSASSECICVIAVACAEYDRSFFLRSPHASIAMSSPKNSSSCLTAMPNVFVWS